MSALMKLSQFVTPSLGAVVAGRCLRSRAGPCLARPLHAMRGRSEGPSQDERQFAHDIADDDSGRSRWGVRVDEMPPPNGSTEAIGECDWDAAMVNVVHLIGNTGRDVNLLNFNSGYIKGEVPLAVNGAKDKTHWFDIECWGPLAERMYQQVRKGQKIAVSGRLEQSSWQDRQTGAKRSKTVVVASSIQLVRREFNAQQLTPAQHTYPPSGSSRMSEPASEPRSPSPWDELFSSPRSYYDNRTTKRNPKAPDFVHKETKEGLWLDSYRTPQWVHQQIDDLYHEERDDELAANF